MNKRIYKHQCKDCDTRFYIEDLKLVSIARCPKCKGKSICFGEHKIEHDEHEKECEKLLDKAELIIEIRKRNLLVIELETESSVPKVFYKGEEIHFKTNITFDWETDTDTHGGLSYAIEHYVKDKGYPVCNRIERRVKSHAT